MQLPLWAHLLVSAAAIGAIAWMVRWLKPGVAPSITHDQALHLFRDDFPRVESAGAEMAPDGRTVMITAPSGSIVGCVTLVGLRWTTRRIGARDVAAARADGVRTRISFTDFIWPAMIIGCRDENEARDWADRFNAMRRPDHA